MFRFKLFFCILFLSLIATYFLSRFTMKTNSQSSNRAIVVDESKFNNRGSKVYGSIFPLKYNGENLREFTLSQPLPKIWIIAIENQNTDFKKVESFEITTDTQKILYQHWVKSLEYSYTTEIEEFSKNTNYQNEDIDLFNSTIKTENLLIETSINKENNSRNFTSDEASQIIMIIRDKADQIIKEVKNIRKND